MGTGRPVTEKYHALIISMLVAYVISDLGIQYIRPKMLPSDAPPVKPSEPIKIKYHTLAEYDVIKQKNIFNEDGKIGSPLGESSEAGGDSGAGGVAGSGGVASDSSGAGDSDKISGSAIVSGSWSLASGVGRVVRLRFGLQLRPLLKEPSYVKKIFYSYSSFYSSPKM